MKVSVSVLKEYDNLSDAVLKVNNSTADFLHVDVMDGVFVSNKRFPIDVVKKIKSISTKPLDVHLMVNNVELIKEYAKLLPEYLTFHVEVINDFSLINYVKGLGVKVGLAINPDTSYDKLIPYIDGADLILIMSVTPGEGGQQFKSESINRIKRLKDDSKNKLIISVDGGINDITSKKVKYAGCDMVVAGSYITNSLNYSDSIEKLR